MLAVSHLQRLLLLLLVILAVLHASSSGSFRRGGEDDEGSGFGGTGRAPTGGSGLGGTGLRPFLGDSGEVLIRVQPEAVSIADQLVDADIRRMPSATTILPPVAIVTTSEFASEKPAEVAITDSIQLQLNRDALVFDRIQDSIEGYLPEPGASPPQATPAAPEEIADVVEIAVDVEAAPATEEPDAVISGSTEDAGSDPARLTWAELATYLAENSQAQGADRPEEMEARSAMQRPNRIRRPELPPVQRGRVIPRPALLPPRVQPMRF